MCFLPGVGRCPSKADRDPGVGVLVHPHDEMLTMILSAVPGRSRLVTADPNCARVPDLTDLGEATDPEKDEPHNPRRQSWLGERSNRMALLVLAIGSICLLTHALRSRRS